MINDFISHVLVWYETYMYLHFLPTNLKKNFETTVTNYDY